MPSQLINCHVVDPNNVGDLLSSPLRYFAFPDFQCETEDIRTVEAERLRDMHILIGGGGLVFERFLPQIQALCHTKGRGKRIFWGVGQQRYGAQEKMLATPFDYGPYLAEADLVGIRDYSMPYPWVPCVSCMHPAFDKARTAQHEVVVFSHKKFQIDIPGLPRMTNSHKNFEEVLDFLASGETILTSSFHGAYWGILLGRRVVAFPFSSKFMTLKHLPALYAVKRWSRVRWQLSLFGRVLYKHQYQQDKLTCDISDWRSYLKDTPIYPEALAECRDRNRWFYQQVMDLISP